MANDISNTEYSQEPQTGTATEHELEAAAAACLIPPTTKELARIAAGCIALGILGAVACMYQGAGYLASHSEEYNRTVLSKMDGRQKKIYQATQELTEQYDPFVLFELITHAGVSAALVFGGCFVFVNRRSAGGFLATVCLGAIIYVVGRTCLSTWMLVETMRVCQDVLPATGRHAAAYNAGMQVGLFIGFGFAVLWAAAVIGFFVYAISVMRKYQDYVDQQLKAYQDQKVAATFGS